MLRRPQDAFRMVVLLAAVALSHASPCQERQIVLIKGSATPAYTLEQVRLVTRFYGIELQEVTSDSTGAQTIIHALRQPSATAVILPADVLKDLPAPVVRKSLKRQTNSDVPVLITDISDLTDTNRISQWSNGAVLSSEDSPPASASAHLHVWTVDDVTKELSGQDLPSAASQVSCLKISSSQKVQQIVSLVFEAGSCPSFVRVATANRLVYFEGKKIPRPTPKMSSPHYLPEKFSQLLTVMLFVRSIAGARAWHAPGHYANFTVDDVSLVQPFGNLDLSELRLEMEKHNFHTTLAFIPWNYARSEGGTVSLVRNYPGRFSICVHGDEHDHAEFMETSSQYKSRDDMINEHRFRIRQALARMDEFSRLTHIPYDRVMVFPHFIGPEPTLGLLKDYGFDGTANSLNVPQGAAWPDDPLFAFRNVTLRYGNLPSYWRYSVEATLPDSFLAIQSFLENPILLYAHEEFFAEGISRFNQFADEVNKIEPKTEWTGLGQIMKHSYLMRRTGQNQYDVKSFTSDLVLHNSDLNTSRYSIEKEENFRPSVLAVLVDGVPVHLQKLENAIKLELTIPPGQSREVLIQYASPSSTSPIDISKSSLRSRLLRHISDFRDLTLARNAGGRRLIRFYYHDLDPEAVGSGRLSFLLGLVFLTGIIVLIVFFRGNRNSRT